VTASDEQIFLISDLECDMYINTKNNDIVLECQNFFGFLPVSQRIAIRTSRFLERFICSENLLCNVFKRRALCHKSEINLG